jgi:hypothetical protein
VPSIELTPNRSKCADVLEADAAVQGHA